MRLHVSAAVRLPSFALYMRIWDGCLYSLDHYCSLPNENLDLYLALHAVLLHHIEDEASRFQCLCAAEAGLVMSVNAECGASLALSTTGL